MIEGSQPRTYLSVSAVLVQQASDLKLMRTATEDSDPGPGLGRWSTDQPRSRVCSEGNAEVLRIWTRADDALAHSVVLGVDRFDSLEA